MILVILGYRADEIASRITMPPRSRIRVNRDFRKGMSSSVKCGITNSPPDAEAFMILLGDQPLIDTNVINKLIDSYRAGKHGIMIPVYNGRRGHPVIFDARYREELLFIGDQGAREVVYKHAADIFEVQIDSPNILADMDTPQDYQEAKKQAAERQTASDGPESNSIPSQ
jgi:molybdenum cofactor cytidylyltransferase